MKPDPVLTRREQLLGRHAALFYREPVHIVRGNGVLLYDAEGHEYVDMYNNVPCVGHANPVVANAVAEQLATLNVHSRYLHEGVLDLAERLAELHAEPLTTTVFACSGTEANEVAMNMARVVTGGRGFICTDAAYHGNSAQVGKLTHVAPRPEAGTDVRSVPFPQKLRPLVAGASEADLAAAYVEEVQNALDGFAQDGVPLAGMLVCPLFANEGLPDIPAGFMAAAAERVRAAGGVVIVDEVQAGYCRSGRWWGYEVTEVEPDIVTMGKPMGNGIPLAAAMSSRANVEAYRERTRYFNTFASSPVQAAAGLAVLNEIRDRQLREQVTQVGAYLREQLAPMVARDAVLGDLRGHGLFVGIECVRDGDPDREAAVDLVNRLKDGGILTSNAGAAGNVIKLRPPLVFERSHADRFLEVFDSVLTARHGGG